MIRVLLVDDHAVVRAGLARLLGGNDDIEVVADTSSGAEAVELALRTSPDIALVDLAMPAVDGIETTRLLRAACPDVHVVILTAFSDRQQILGALDAGAVGYLLKDAEPEEILRGVRAAARGETPLDPKAADALSTRRAPDERSALTPREREVLKLVADGLPNKQIARALGISEKTVKAHLTKVFEAIGVTDRTSAALWAHRNGVATRP